MQTSLYSQSTHTATLGVVPRTFGLWRPKVITFEMLTIGREGKQNL